MKGSFEITLYLFLAVMNFSSVFAMSEREISASSIALVLVFLLCSFAMLYLSVSSILRAIKEGMTPEPTGKTAENFKRV